MKDSSFLEVSEQTSAIGEYKQISHASAGDSIAATIMPEAAFDEVKVKFCCEALVFDVTPPKQAPLSRTTRDGLAAMADMEVTSRVSDFVSIQVWSPPSGSENLHQFLGRAERSF